MGSGRTVAALALVLVAALGALVWWVVAGSLPRPAGFPGVEPVAAGEGLQVEAPEDPLAEAAGARGDAEAGPGVAERVQVGADQPAIVGRVVDVVGRPIEGVQIEAWPRRKPGSTQMDFAMLLEQMETSESRPREPSGTTVTGVDGRFRLLPATEDGWTRLRVDARGHLRLTHNCRPPGDADLDVGDLQPEPGAVVAGQVTDGRGDPLEGVLLEVRESQFLDRFPGAGGWREAAPGDRTPRTDVDGRFELVHVKPGDLSLIASHRRHPKLRHDLGEVKAGEEKADVRLVMPLGASISGWVSGLPADADGVRVKAHRRQPGSENQPGLPAAASLSGRRSTAVAEDGTFEIEGLRPGEAYVVCVVRSSGGVVRAPTKCSDLVEVGAGTRGVELRWNPGVTVTFRVVDAKGAEPITRLQARHKLVNSDGFPAGFTGLVELRGLHAEDHPEGRVTLEGIRPRQGQKLSMTVEALGYRLLRREHIELPTVGVLDLGTVSLERGPVVEVRVLDGEAGTPLEGALVSLTHLRGDGMDDVSIVNFRSRNARTDAEGRCAINGYPGRRTTVTVAMSDYARYRSEPFDNPDSGTVEHEVRAVVGGVVRVEVVTRAGDPAADVEVEHRRPDSRRSKREKVDGDGVVVFDNLVPGEHRFRVWTLESRFFELPAREDGAREDGEDGAESGWRAVDVRNGAATQLVLDIAAVTTLRGVVRADGAPVHGARVTLVAGEGEDGWLGRGADTGADGAFTLRSTRAGPHRLKIKHLGQAMAVYVPVVLSAGDLRVDVDLPATEVYGRVLGPAGEPVENATVWCTLADDSGSEQDWQGAGRLGGEQGTAHVRTPADGSFTMAGLPTDVAVRIVAVHDDYAIASSEPMTLGAGGSVDDMVLRLSAAGRLRVTCADRSSRVSLVLRRDGTDPGDGQEVRRVMRGGKALIRGLRPGVWQIEIRRRGVDPATRKATVVAGEIVEVAL